MKRVVLVGYLISLCLFSRVFSATFDTTTGADLDKALIVSSHNTFGSGEYANGVVLFKAGFSLGHTGTTQVGVALPVNGNIYLNGGTLSLTDNMWLAGVNGRGHDVKIIGPGFIMGNGYTIHLAANLILEDYVKIIHYSDLKICGHSHYLDFTTTGTSPSGFLDLTEGVFLQFTDIQLNHFSDQTVKFQDPLVYTDYVGFKNTTIVASGDYTLKAWRLFIEEDVKFVGAPGTVVTFFGTNFYFNSRTGVFSGGTLYFGPGLTFRFGRYSSSPTFRTFRTQGSDCISYFDNCNVIFMSNHASDISYGTAQMNFWNGSAIINGRVDFSTTLSDFALNMGNGIAAEDFSMNFLPGSRLVLDDNVHMEVKNVN